MIGRICATDRCFLLEFCDHFNGLWKAPDPLLDKKRIQVRLLHLLKG